MKNILHQLNLDTVGGVENLFTHYVSTSTTSVLAHHVLVANKRIHASMKDKIIKNAASVHYVKYAGPLKLPHALRDMQAKMVINRLKPDMMVYWNSAKDLSNIASHATTPYVYYDHGLSWLHPDSDHYRSFLQNASQIIACGHASRRMLQLRWGVDDARIIVVTNGLRPDAAPLAAKAKSISQDKPIHLGFAGRLIPLKGAAIAIQVLHLLQKKGVMCELHIAGEGSERPSLEALAKRLQLKSHVNFLGVIDTMQDFYQSIDFFISPALRDPYPLVAIEALSHGCVPIVTAVDGYPDIITAEEAGVCIRAMRPLSDYPSLGGNLSGIPSYVYNPKDDVLCEPLLPDPLHMAEAIFNLINHPHTYHRMSQQGIDEAKTRFSFSHYVSALDTALLGACS